MRTIDSVELDRPGGAGRQIGTLLGFLAASFGAAALGSVATAQGLPVWYRTLKKPSVNPPNGVFGPVWTVLYTLMAISAWLVSRGSADRPKRAALTAWGVQLGLNALWSLVFFGQRQLGGAVAVIGALWAAIAVCAALSARVSRLAGWLLVPYLLWVSFASYLNTRIWQLNR